ncbi:MAG TPA: dethiobiotin synthase [Thermodesulfovibrionales bacterium]|nr:dethiobiotin synthase [Thermodesulfovibrionales bacterium]
MVRGFFISGTDTGVGKTIVTAALIRCMRARGIYAGAMKPIETGCSRVGDVLYPHDGIFLKRAAGMDESFQHITPCRFETAAAPLTASEAEGTEIDVGIIMDEFGLLAKAYKPVIVEGVGGILVPIRRDYFVIDLVRDLELPLIVVTTPFLGTINHTLLTVNYAIDRGVDVAGIVINFNRPPDGAIAEETSPALIQRLSGVPMLGTFPYLTSVENETLERTALMHLDIDPVLNR